jgi:hypothetical protein
MSLSSNVVPRPGRAVLADLLGVVALGWRRVG